MGRHLLSWSRPGKAGKSGPDSGAVVCVSVVGWAVQLSRDVQRWTGRVDKAEARLLELQAALQALAHGTLSLSLSPSLSRATQHCDLISVFGFCYKHCSDTVTYRAGQASPGPSCKV